MGILISPTIVYTSIPNGVKNNVYLIVDEKKNKARQTNGKQSEYCNDCGVWDKKRKGTPTSYYHLQGSLVSTMKFNKTQNLYLLKKGY